jgi:predicted RNase H-like nuclease
MYIGVDGCPDGWIAVWYDEDEYVDSDLYEHIDELWADLGDSANTLLIDVPIGLRENSAEKRPCDEAARSKLGSPRQRSVFSVPIRNAVHEDNYEDGKALQEKRTNSSIGVQSWNITDLIAQLDTFLLETDTGAVGTVREAHPEICFWALNDEIATSYSKTQQPAAAFWERVGILQHVDETIMDSMRDAGSDLDARVGNDDIVDAFALALTASPKTDDFQTLPDVWPENDGGDPMGLPMEMVYAYRK